MAISYNEAHKHIKGFLHLGSVLGSWRYDPERMAELMHATRKNLGLSVDESAAKSGVNKQLITALETRQSLLESPDLLRLADAYSLDMATIINSATDY